jgi:DNA-binding transcriptional MerR regulator
MNTREAAGITGISVRTLHHYDKIGLLCPDRNPDNDYRNYSDEDLDLLQQILFFKECGFSLTEIKRFLANPNFDREKAFVLQKDCLLQEQKRINAMLKTLDKTLKSWKGDKTMTQSEKFYGFGKNHNPYEEEARRLWGNETVDQSNEKMDSMTEEEQNQVFVNMDQMFRELAKLCRKAPESEVVQNAINSMYRFFNENFGVTYTLEAFAGLGQLYISDSRFTQNIDQYAEGLSAFLRKAMGYYADSQKNS